MKSTAKANICAASAVARRQETLRLATWPPELFLLPSTGTISSPGGAANARANRNKVGGVTRAELAPPRSPTRAESSPAALAGERIA